MLCGSRLWPCALLVLVPSVAHPNTGALEPLSLCDDGAFESEFVAAVSACCTELDTTLDICILAIAAGMAAKFGTILKLRKGIEGLGQPPPGKARAGFPCAEAIKVAGLVAWLIPGTEAEVVMVGAAALFWALGLAAFFLVSSVLVLVGGKYDIS